MSFQKSVIISLICIYTALTSDVNAASKRSKDSTEQNSSNTTEKLRAFSVEKSAEYIFLLKEGQSFSFIEEHFAKYKVLSIKKVLQKKNYYLVTFKNDPGIEVLTQEVADSSYIVSVQTNNSFSSFLDASTTNVKGYTYVKTEKLDKDVKGNPIKKEYFENEKSTLEITTIKHATLTGEFVVVGNAPFTELSFRTLEGESYYLKPQYKERYWKKQGKTLTLSGKVEKRLITKKKGGKTLRRFWFYPKD